MYSLSFIVSFIYFLFKVSLNRKLLYFLLLDSYNFKVIERINPYYYYIIINNYKFIVTMKRKKERKKEGCFFLFFQSFLMKFVCFFRSFFGDLERLFLRSFDSEIRPLFVHRSGIVCRSDRVGVRERFRPFDRRSP